MFEDMEKLDIITILLEMLKGNEKLVAAMYLIHCAVEESGESLDDTIDTVKSLIEEVMEAEKRGDLYD